MTHDLPKSVVIVDRSRASGYSLRSALVKSDVIAHVFNNFPSALRMLERKAVATVVVEFDTDRETVEFCDAVRAMKVPVVYSSAPVEPHDLRQFGFNASFDAVPKAPRLFVSYPLAKVRAARSVRGKTTPA